MLKPSTVYIGVEMPQVLCSVKAASLSQPQLMKTCSAAEQHRYNQEQNWWSLGYLSRFSLQDKVSPSVSEGLGSCIPGGHLTRINIASPSALIPLWQFGDAIEMESKGTRLLLHWSHTHNMFWPPGIWWSGSLVQWNLFKTLKFSCQVFVSIITRLFNIFFPFPSPQKHLFLESYRANEPGNLKEAFM